MAETRSSLQSSPTLQSLLESYFLTPSKPTLPLHPSTQGCTPDTSTFSFERGPRYNLYSQLRESRLRAKRIKQLEQGQEFQVPRSEITPPAKRILGFEPDFSDSKRSGRSSVLAQSVSDFSSALRKENRRPAENRVEKSFTPPPGMPKGSRVYGSASKLGGGGGGGGGGSSQSLIAVGEKRGLMGRKSYASFEELKGLSAAAASAIAGESRGGGGRIGRMIEGLKAANTGEKRSTVGAATRTRKSYASFEEIKGWSTVAIAGFSGENSAQSGNKVLGQDAAVLGTRHW
ncbi:hypothetical protein Dimus_023178 [Dionaea muscipula]